MDEGGLDRRFFGVWRAEAEAGVDAVGPHERDVGAQPARGFHSALAHRGLRQSADAAAQNLQGDAGGACELGGYGNGVRNDKEFLGRTGRCGRGCGSPAGEEVGEDFGGGTGVEDDAAGGALRQEAECGLGSSAKDLPSPILRNYNPEPATNEGK
jgi:hypothetical protein